MKKLYLVLLFSIVVSIFLVSQASAFCRIDGYTKDNSNHFIDSKVMGYCANSGESLSFNKPSGELWLFSFGGIFDTCQSYCGDIYINASKYQNKVMIKFGYPSGKYPMNQNNMQNWNTGNTHEINITINDVDKVKPKPKPTPKPKLIETKQQEVSRINNFIKQDNKRTQEVRVQVLSQQEQNKVENSKIIQTQKISFFQKIINWFKEVF